MSHLKRLWKDEELLGMIATISNLRRMRSAAVMRKSTLSLRIKRAFNHWHGGQEQIHSQQEALSDAEELADATGDFFAAKLSKTNRGNTEFEKWQDLLLDAEKQYLLYGTTTYAKTSILEVARNSIIGRLRHIHIDPYHTLHWDLLENNNLGVESIGELINKDVGIISPLSGDYLMASVYSSYLRRTRGKSFPTRAAALSKDLSEIVLPVDGKGNLPFADKSIISIYIDTTETGDTARALLKKLQGVYSQKTIPTPYLEKSEFTPSKKIERYWDSRE